MRLLRLARSAAALLLALAACQESKQGPSGACRAVGQACGGNADCCSYGCVQGLCVPDPVEGGYCRTTADCAMAMTCKGGHCTSMMVCRDANDVCSLDTQCCSGNCTTTGVCVVGNTPPVAVIASLTPPVLHGVTVTLDGRGSYDIDGQALMYEWTVPSKPTNSQAQPPSYTAISPTATFTPDVDGDYTVQLRVGDGIVMSTPVTLTFTATNAAPVARAGTYPDVQKNTSVQLDGTTSSDANNDPLTYQWTVTAPSGNPVTLDYGTPANPAKPRFLASEAGRYSISLIVNDGIAPSVPGPATVNSANGAPTANAGSNQYLNFSAGLVVTLDGSRSADPNSDPLSYTWTFTPAAGSALNAGTALDLSDPVHPKFMPDVADATGSVYTATLTVSDGQLSSPPSTVTVTVFPSIAKLGYWIVDAEYSRSLDRIVAVSSSGTSSFLHVIDPSSGAEPTPLALSKPPLCVAVSTDGKALVGHDAAVTYVDLAAGTPTKIAEYTVGLPVWAAALGPARSTGGKSHRYAYLMASVAASLSNYGWNLDLAAQTPTVTAFTSYIAAGSRVALDDAGTTLLALSMGFLKFDVTNGPATTFSLANYATSPADGWLSEHATPLLYGSDGKAMLVSTLAYAGIIGSYSTPIQIEHANHRLTVSADLLAAIPRLWPPLTSDTEVRVFDGTSLVPLATHALWKWGSTSAAYASHGRFVFVSNDGSAAYVVVAPDSASPDSEEGIMAIPLP